MLVIKVIVLQAFWFLVVLQSKELGLLCLSTTTLLLLFLNYLIYEPSYTVKRYCLFALLFSLYGFLTDKAQVSLGIISSDSYVLSYVFLWSIFVMYYNDLFMKLKDLKVIILAALGAVGGALAYLSAYKLGAINLGESGELGLISFNAANWAIFFPLSIKFVHSERLWNKILDYSVVYSFDLSGYKRHQKKFFDDYDLNSLSDKNILVTGGTSGIGEGAVKTLSKMKCKVHFTGRDESKAKGLVAQLGSDYFHRLDLADVKSINEFVKSSPSLDVVILNAGGMPEKKRVSDFGVELQCASQLVGHLYLIESLRESGKLKPGARIIWVSSGGMYLKKLDLKNLFDPVEYDKVAVYANVKRSQVTLVEEFRKLDRWKDFTVVAMHPGWVRTKGLEEALPGFFKFFARDLRSPEQGADTMVWLGLTKANIRTGDFYFDRKVVSAYVHKSFIPNETQRTQLLSQLNQYIELFKRQV